ncbi:MAG: Gfo/Idh/MocA family oxidoreductase [bacterium]|nr:Gfo/Idh/MocA family oxidoreductase [bacterium]
MLNKNVISKLGRILVLGAGGYMGRYYVNSLLQAGIDGKLIIGVDTNASNLREVAAAYPTPIYMEDIQEALRLKPEIALVMVNSPIHQRVIEQCYEAGVRKFFSEKPLVYTLDQLRALDRLNLKNLYTGYLINFSGIVEDLFQFMDEKNLIVVQARSLWGKNWCAVDRPMGGDAEEEMPHSLALILSAIEKNQKIIGVESFARFTYVPYMKPQVTKKAKMLDLGFPEKLNDSSLADFSIRTDRKTINAHILTSFNLYEQQRRVEISFAEHGSNSDFPKFKACLEFDTNGKDLLRIKNARNDEEVLAREFKGNKLQEQLETVLKSFAGENIDLRLVGFEQASRLVRLIQKSIESAN